MERPPASLPRTRPLIAGTDAGAPGRHPPPRPTPLRTPGGDARPGEHVRRSGTNRRPSTAGWAHPELRGLGAQNTIFCVPRTQFLCFMIHNEKEIMSFETNIAQRKTLYTRLPLFNA